MPAGHDQPLHRPAHGGLDAVELLQRRRTRRRAPWISSAGQSTQRGVRRRGSRRGTPGRARRRTSRGRRRPGRRGGGPSARAGRRPRTRSRVSRMPATVMSSTNTCGASSASPFDGVMRGVDERDRGAVAVADEQRRLDAPLREQRGQHVERLLPEEAGRARPRRRAPSGRARGARTAITRRPVASASARREAAPQPDRAEPFVQQHDRPAGAGPLRDLDHASRLPSRGARRHLERRRPRRRGSPSRRGARRRRRRHRRPAGGDRAHAAAVARGARRRRPRRLRPRSRARRRSASPRAPCSRPPASRSSGCGAPGRSLARARPVLRGRRSRGRQPPLPHRPRARPREGPHARGGGRPPRRRRARRADPLRRPQHPAPRAARRRRHHLRVQQRGRLRPERGERSDGPTRARPRSPPRAAGSTPSARCTATASARRAGRSRTTAAAGGSTTSSSTACAPSPPPTRTTGAAPASATTRRSSSTSRARRVRRRVEVEHAWIPLADGSRLAARHLAARRRRGTPGARRPRVPALPQARRHAARDEPARAVRRSRLRRRARRHARLGRVRRVIADEYLPQEQDDALDVIAWIAPSPGAPARSA